MRKTIGVIGGGQLAWMMAQVAPSENIDLWYKLLVILIRLLV